jgi:hypothetical protein
MRRSSSPKTTESSQQKNDENNSNQLVGYTYPNNSNQRVAYTYPNNYNHSHISTSRTSNSHISIYNSTTRHTSYRSNTSQTMFHNNPMGLQNFSINAGLYLQPNFDLHNFNYNNNIGQFAFNGSNHEILAGTYNFSNNNTSNRRIINSLPSFTVFNNTNNTIQPIEGSNYIFNGCLPSSSGSLTSSSSSSSGQSSRNSGGSNNNGFLLRPREQRYKYTQSIMGNLHTTPVPPISQSSIHDVSICESLPAQHSKPSTNQTAHRDILNRTAVSEPVKRKKKWKKKSRSQKIFAPKRLNDVGDAMLATTKATFVENPTIQVDTEVDMREVLDIH